VAYDFVRRHRSQAPKVENMSPTEHFDVLIVGAGISGVGVAYHLCDQRPATSFVILEAKDTFGGTWVTHTYPGIRSDSDLYTFGYRFKPWIGAPIATAEEILSYMGEVIDENDLDEHIRYHHHISAASWSSDDARWTVTATNTISGETRIFTANFLWMCQGYYKHDEGYTPDWHGMADYKGQVVHPQTWPDDIELEDKQVVVIGSGATAATLVPAIAADCGHVTVLQRSPTYFRAGRNAIEIADQLRELDIQEEWIHEIVRRKTLFDQNEFTKLSFAYPDEVKDALINDIRELLPDGYNVETHFTPTYRPWRQRLAFVPNGDLFESISSGKASMVTDEIERFTKKGILTTSGEELIADIVVSATGFHLSVLGNIDFTVDGKVIDFADTVTYRGMMFTGVPNLAWVFGYFRASWTLRVDLMADFMCRMFDHMESAGATQVVPMLRPEDEHMDLGPWMDPENFNPGYLTRSMHLMPKSGDAPRWAHTQDYWTERRELPLVDLADDGLTFL
jgi:cation diffusion facilitator CzcD-associated flavoprotein CzcO